MCYCIRILRSVVDDAYVRMMAYSLLLTVLLHYDDDYSDDDNGSRLRRCRT